MTALARLIHVNAVRYFRDGIRHHVALAREPGVSATVRAVRLRCARTMAAECRRFWSELRVVRRANRVVSTAHA